MLLPYSLVPLAFARLPLSLSLYRPRLGKLLIGIDLFGLIALLTPWSAGSLVQSLQQFPAISDDRLSKRQPIVVLFGGIHRDAPKYRSDAIVNVLLERLRYALHLSKVSGLPLSATGGAPESGIAEAAAMRKNMETDFRGEIKWIEDRLLDTSSSAHLSLQILNSRNIQPIASLSNAWHLAGAIANFEVAGLAVVPAPMGF